MSNTPKEYGKQAKVEAFEKRSQFGQQPSHPAPSPPASEYHSTASVDGEMEIGDSVSQVNQVRIFEAHSHVAFLDILRQFHT